MNLFRHLQEEHGFTFLFIAWFIMVEYLCDRVGVMYHGKLVTSDYRRCIRAAEAFLYKAVDGIYPNTGTGKKKKRESTGWKNHGFIMVKNLLIFVVSIFPVW